MDKEKLAADLMATFLAEIEEHVRAMNENLLALEKTVVPVEREGRIQALFRSAHSLKGAARAVGVLPMEHSCHRLEELLSGVRDGRIAVDRRVIELLFFAADAVQDAGVKLRAGSGLQGSLLEGLEGRINGLGGEPAPAPSGDAPGAREPKEPAAADAASDWVRVASGKLDSLMKRSGELLVASRSLELRRAQVDELQRLVGRWIAEGRASGKHDPSRRVEAEGLRRMARDIDGLSAALAADQRTMDVAVRRMDEETRGICMLPFAQVFQGLERAVRDLARASAKEVDMVMEGGEVEMDRAVLEGLRDPLLQLARNAVDHGIESPAARRAAGKPERGRITITTALRGASVEVTVADDGRGLDCDRIRARAGADGLAVPEDERELMRMILLPGFSTAPAVTEVSGRGIGLDIARTQLELLHGTLEVWSVSGEGCRFTLDVPLTLTTVRALLLTAGGRPFALPLSGVRRLLRADPGEFRQVEGQRVLMIDGVPVVAADLADLLGLPPDERRRGPGKLPLVVLAAGERLVAVAVEELLAEREILVKHPGPRLAHLRTILGVTVLPDGGTALILSPGELVRIGSAAKRPQAVVPAAEAKRRIRLLVADDSLTTRSLEKSILEGAGFEVRTVPGGVEAWDALLAHGADLLVSDCDMPRMNGYELTRAVRTSQRFRDLPVILLTGMESDGDKARGLEAGASAYLLKSGFDQKTLIETIQRLL